MAVSHSKIALHLGGGFLFLDLRLAMPRIVHRGEPRVKRNSETLSKRLT
jgi:hypothetical protein